MSVQFDEGQMFSRTPGKATTRSIPSFLVSWGIAKNEASAATLLFAASCIVLVLSIAIYMFSSHQKDGVSPQEYQDPAGIAVPPS